MTIESNAFEIERRVVLLKPTTTMPDNTQLGFNDDPNTITTPATDGEFLVYNAPQGTFFMQSDGVVWAKKEAGAGASWEIFGSGGQNSNENILFEDGNSQWRINLVNNELRFERNDAFDDTLDPEAVQPTDWVDYASVGGSLRTDAIILTEPHFIGALLTDPNAPNGVEYQNIVSFTANQELVLGSSQRQAVITTAADTSVKRSRVVKRLYEIEPRPYEQADEVYRTVRRDGLADPLNGDVEELVYQGTVDTGTGVDWIRIHALAYRIVDVFGANPDGRVNVRIQVETKGQDGIWYNVKRSSLDFSGPGLAFGVGEFMNNLTPRFEHRQGDRIRVTLTPEKGQGFVIAGSLAEVKNWDDDTLETEFKPWVLQTAEQFDHFPMIDTSNATEEIGNSTGAVLDHGINIQDADGYYYRAATTGQHGDARNIDLGNYVNETNILSGTGGVFNIYVDTDRFEYLWSDNDRIRLADGINEPTIFRDVTYLELDLEDALTVAINKADNLDLIRVFEFQLDYQVVEDPNYDPTEDYYRVELLRKSSNTQMFENQTDFDFIDQIKGKGGFYLQGGQDRTLRTIHPPQPFTFQDLENDTEASNEDRAKARRVIRWYFQHPVRIWGMETTPGDEATFVPSYRVKVLPLRRERMMTEGTVLDTVLSSIGEIEYKQAKDEDMPTLHTRHKLALADHRSEWLFFTGALRVNYPEDRFFFITENDITETMVWDITKYDPDGLTGNYEEGVRPNGGVTKRMLSSDWTTYSNNLHQIGWSKSPPVQNVRLHVVNNSCHKFNLAFRSKHFDNTEIDVADFHHDFPPSGNPVNSPGVKHTFTMSFYVYFFITSEDDDTLGYRITRQVDHKVEITYDQAKNKLIVKDVTLGSKKYIFTFERERYIDAPHRETWTCISSMLGGADSGIMKRDNMGLFSIPNSVKQIPKS